MHLADQEFEKLQNLACISFDSEEKKIFLEKLEGVIEFLWQLKNVSVVSDEVKGTSDNKYLEPKEGVEEYDDPKGLLRNVEHEVMNESVVVKSVLN